MTGYHEYLRAVQDVLVAGRRLRSGATRRMGAAVALAVAFPTWRTLTQERGLDDEEAAALMCRLVEESASAASGQPGVRIS